MLCHYRRNEFISSDIETDSVAGSEWAMFMWAAEDYYIFPLVFPSQQKVLHFIVDLSLYTVLLLAIYLFSFVFLPF